VTGFVIYDAGALIAADKNEKPFLVRHEELLAHDVTPVIPAPVLAQAWIPGSKHATLHRVVSGCEVLAFTEDDARDVARLCRRAGHADVVDGFVALAALNYASAPVITSDVDDIRALLSPEPSGARVVVRKP
jgi:hypothetical protein